jgi:hypothetical protein
MLAAGILGPKIVRFPLIIEYHETFQTFSRHIGVVNFTQMIGIVIHQNVTGLIHAERRTSRATGAGFPIHNH